MRSFSALTLAALGLTTAACASHSPDPPNVAIARHPTVVKDCAYKGIIDYAFTELHTDVPSIRAPETRLRVAKLGGNVLLVLPGRSALGSGPVDKAVVYACAAVSSPAPQASR